MADISSVSSSELAERRRKLRRQRLWRNLQGSWQVAAVGGLAIGLVWSASRPDWMLRDPRQVTIEGNKTLPAETIRSLLPIQYPQFLLTLQPRAIIERLESQAPIAEASVTRQLFPPSLTVHIQERYPVAVLYAAAANSKTATQSVPMALLDERGTLISYENYVSLNDGRQLPNLKIIGMQDRSNWQTLYEQISRSPVKISAVDWSKPGNIILSTEVGEVRVGAYGDRFPQQLQMLDQMRHLPDDLDVATIDYIDLSNPKEPLLQLVKSASGDAGEAGSDSEATATEETVPLAPEPPDEPMP